MNVRIDEHKIDITELRHVVRIYVSVHWIRLFKSQVRHSCLSAYRSRSETDDLRFLSNNSFPLRGGISYVERGNTHSGNQHLYQIQGSFHLRAPPLSRQDIPLNPSTFVLTLAHSSRKVRSWQASLEEWSLIPHVFDCFGSEGYCWDVKD